MLYVKNPASYEKKSRYLCVKFRGDRMRKIQKYSKSFQIYDSPLTKSEIAKMPISILHKLLRKARYLAMTSRMKQLPNTARNPRARIKKPNTKLVASVDGAVDPLALPLPREKLSDTMSSPKSYQRIM